MAPRMKVEVASNSASEPKRQTKAQASSQGAKASARAPKAVVDPPAAPSAGPKAQERPARDASHPKATPRPKAKVEPIPAEIPDQEPQSQSSHNGAADAPTSRLAGARTAASGWVHNTFPGHENAFWGGVIALVLALLVFAIGFFRVLLICLLVVVGVAIGQVLDGDPKIIRMVRGLMGNDGEQR